MKKLLVSTLIATFALAAVAFAEDEINIGYVLAGPDDYYNVSAEVVQLYAEQQGWNMTVLNSEYTPEKEIANFEDLISMGVDGIMCIAANNESVQTAADLAAEAGIPTVFISSGPAENYTSFVTGNWAYMGHEHAKYLNENMPDAKVALVAGVAGQDIATLITDAFKADFQGEIVAEKDCNWSRSEAMDYAQDLISSGEEIDVIFTYNDEMAAGVQQALEEAGYAPGEILIASNNGKPIGIDMIKDGWISLDIECAPTTEAYMGALAMQAILDGKTPNKDIYNMAIDVTLDTIDDAITWDPKEFMENVEELAPYEETMSLILE